MSSTHKALLEQARTEAPSILTAAVIQRYEKTIDTIRRDPSKCHIPLYFGLDNIPFCLPEFEARVKEDGYYCQFGELDDSPWGTPRRGYLISEKPIPRITAVCAVVFAVCLLGIIFGVLSALNTMKVCDFSEAIDNPRCI